MFSPKLWKILNLRLVLMDFGCSTPFKWDTVTKRLYLAGSYCSYNYATYQGYVIGAYVSLFLSLVSRMFYDYSWSIEDELESAPSVVPDSAFIAVDIAMCALFWCVACVQHVFRKYASEIVYFFNQLVKTNLILQDMFPTGLSSNKLYKQSVAVTEYLVLLICIVSVLTPLIFGVFFLQDIEPLHRFFVHVLEVKPKLDWATLPIIVFIMWSVLQCSNTIILGLIIGLMYIKFYFFWISSLQPKRLSGPGKYVTELGTLSGGKLIHLYKTQQVLNQVFSEFIANRFIAVHQATYQIVFVLSTLFLIRYFDVVMFVPGFQLAFVAIGSIICIAYLETKMVAETELTSITLIQKVRNLTGKRRHNIVYLTVGRSWYLRINLVYPYYKLGRDTFLEFIETSVEFIMDALVASDHRII